MALRAQNPPQGFVPLRGKNLNGKNYRRKASCLFVPLCGKNLNGKNLRRKALRPFAVNANSKLHAQPKKALTLHPENKNNAHTCPSQNSKVK